MHTHTHQQIHNQPAPPKITSPQTNKKSHMRRRGGGRARLRNGPQRRARRLAHARHRLQVIIPRRRPRVPEPIPPSSRGVVPRVLEGHVLRQDGADLRVCVCVCVCCCCCFLSMVLWYVWGDGCGWMGGDGCGCVDVGGGLYIVSASCRCGRVISPPYTPTQPPTQRPPPPQQPHTYIHTPTH
jgi:hypothetical protein